MDVCPRFSVLYCLATGRSLVQGVLPIRMKCCAHSLNMIIQNYSLEI
jgi:hypothetical protein